MQGLDDFLAGKSKPTINIGLDMVTMIQAGVIIIIASVISAVIVNLIKK